MSVIVYSIYAGCGGKNDVPIRFNLNFHYFRSNRIQLVVQVKLFSQGTRSSAQVQLVSMIVIYKIRIVSVLHTLSRTQISTLPTISGKLCGIRVGRLMSMSLTATIENPRSDFTKPKKESYVSHHTLIDIFECCFCI